MEDSFDLSLSFTETQLAEIQAVLPKLDGSVTKLDDHAQHTSYTTIAKADATAKTAPVSGSRPTLTVTGNGPSIDNSANSDERTDKETSSFTVHVTGIEAGDYRMFVYSGKLKKHTAIKPEQRFIQVVH